MENSKFWHLRCQWFKLKHKLNIIDANAIQQTSAKQSIQSIITKTPLINLNRHTLLAYVQKSKRYFPYKPQLKKAIRKTSSKLSYYAALITNEPYISNDIQYQRWLRKHYPRPQDFDTIKTEILTLAYQPLISIIVPVYNPEQKFLEQAIASVVDQIYPHWELCLVDDCSTKPYVKTVLEGYCQQDRRIKVVYHQQNQHICRASNSALEIATGEYVALLDHDDRLAPHALSEIVKLLNQNPEADFIYSDEDKIDRENIHQTPFFKPDWCPDSMLSRMYTCHLGVYRRSLVQSVGGFRVGFEGSQDYDLVLRLTEKTDHIFHLPQVLYHWRIHPQSTAANSDAKPYAALAAQKAIEEAIARRQEPGKIVINPDFAGVYTVRYNIPDFKLVSIIIPTKDLADTLDTCLKSIFDQTIYPNYEVIVIDNASVEMKTSKCLKYWQQKEPQRFRSYYYDIPFNYSQINNYAVEQAQGDYLLFLNNDTEILTPDWIDAMVEQSQRKSIGAVGSLLLYPDLTVQHAGVILGIGGVAGHSHKNFPAAVPGYISQLVSTNNYSAVTAACLMCRREVFELVGGFETELAIAFNDIDFCLKLISHGFRNVYLPHVVLYHYESKSRGYEDTPVKKARFAQEINYMRQKWSQICDRDPCYNPNLTKNHEDYRLKI
jgi:O-antigen biosynthesis protein